MKKIFQRKKQVKDNNYSWIDPRRLFAKRAASDCALCRGLKTLIHRLAKLPERLRSWLQQKSQRPISEHNLIYQFHVRNYPGSRNRSYMVHVPPGYNGRGAVPLVVVLHGCRQTHLDIRQVSGFDAIADREGFIVLYPYITSYSGFRTRNCWGWWFKNEITPGQGEVEDLWQIIEEVKGHYHVDPHRIHVTGLSSGGGMAVAMMVVHADKIASGAVVAGAPYSETARAVSFARFYKGSFKPVGKIMRAMEDAMGPCKKPPPIMVVDSHEDETVNIQAAKNIRDSWAACHQLDLQQPVGTSSGTTGKTRWEHIGYRGGHRQTLIETLFLSGPGHGWYGGAPGNYSYPDAPDISKMMWSFFSTHVHQRSAREPSTSGRRVESGSLSQAHTV